MRFPPALILLASLAAAPATAQTAAPADGPLKVENYYRVKWGGMGQFLTTYHKQHEALLREMMRQGYISEVTVEMPFTHMGGSTRWDVRTTIVYKHGADGVRGGLENLHTEIIGFSASEQPGRLRDRSRE